MRALYRLYMAALSAVGIHAGRGNGEHANALVPPITSQSEITFAQADEQASRLGDRYRGAGVLMVGLGAVIVFCAVAPHALESGHEAARMWGWAEVVFMVCVVGIAIWIRKSGLRARWIDSRQTAETLRYAPLAARIEAAMEALDAEQQVSAGQSLRFELTQVLGSQIQYNGGRHAHYEKIELGGARIGMAVFAIALASALAHMVVHWPWLLFFTAVGPTLAGAIHGINSFLRLADMADDHGETARVLAGIQEQLQQVDGPEGAHAQLVQLAQSAYRVLVRREAQWRHMASTVEPKLG